MQRLISCRLFVLIIISVSQEVLVKLPALFVIPAGIQKLKDTLQMRNISGLLTFDKVFEKLISEVMIADMKEKTDPAQFGNEKVT